MYLCVPLFNSSLHGIPLQLYLKVVFGACRASLGWFAYEPEWYDMSNMNFAQSEAQSVSIFVHFLLNERVDSLQSDSKGRAHENGNSLVDVVRWSSFGHRGFQMFQPCTRHYVSGLYVFSVLI